MFCYHIFAMLKSSTLCATFLPQSCNKSCSLVVWLCGNPGFPWIPAEWKRHAGLLTRAFPCHRNVTSSQAPIGECDTFPPSPRDVVMRVPPFPCSCMFIGSCCRNGCWGMYSKFSGISFARGSNGVSRKRGRSERNLCPVGVLLGSQRLPMEPASMPALSPHVGATEMFVCGTGSFLGAPSLGSGTSEHSVSCQELLGDLPLLENVPGQPTALRPTEAQ